METVAVLAVIFVAFPWVLFHYITKWKSAASITREDENLLDELHELARRLDERVCTVERIMTAENPNWRSVACDPASIGLEEQSLVRRMAK
jgi:phage shock protein B